MHDIQMTITVPTGLKVGLAVPAEVGMAGSTLHVHAAPIFLDPHPTLGASAPVPGVLAHPSDHPGPVLRSTEAQEVAKQARMGDGIAGRAEGHPALRTDKILPVTTRGCPPIYHPTVRGNTAAVRIPIRQHERPNRRVVESLQIASEEIPQVHDCERIVASLVAAADRNVVVPRGVLDEVLGTASAVDVTARLHDVHGSGLDSAQADGAVRMTAGRPRQIPRRKTVRGRGTTFGHFPGGVI